MWLIVEVALMSSNNDRRRIDEATKYFVNNRDLFESFAKSLMIDFQNDSELNNFIHFIKYRIKDESSLRAKLKRNLTSSDEEDLVNRITDFAGVRIIYLHMDQFSSIHSRVSKILKENECGLLGTPKAYCWDSEYENLFRQADVETELKESMYTTVHYDIVANKQQGITCELQVRSLVEELWGEVSHRVNYPTQSPSESCQDQLKVLARLTSGCGRLVDSIFRAHHKTVK